MSYDGYYHSLAHPDWGITEGQLSRRLPYGYRDGVREPGGWDRPNPRTLSRELLAGNTGHGSYRNRTALMVFFGQQVVEEIIDSQVPACPLEYFNIPIPECDDLYDPNCTVTPWIDGGLMYGTAKAWCDALRSFKDGKLLENPER
eukprot:SM001297S26186  [mRNA]  locus=s1297:60:1959:- [translate_table: standard]